MTEETDDGTPTIGAVLDAWRDALQDELHTALPGRIERYNATEQTADIVPLIKRALGRDDGTIGYEVMPTVRAVPVIWPRSGSWFLHMPLAAGDSVLLVCCERDLARWRQTGDVSPPLDVRHHHLAHAVAIPGLFPRGREISAANTPSSGETAALVLGNDAGATIRVKSGGEVEIAAETVKLGAGAVKGVARLNDSVQVTIPSGTFLTDATGGTLNPSPVVVSGQITSASSNVTAVD